MSDTDRPERVTRDPVNSVILDTLESIGFQRLGIMHNQAWDEDPRHLLFTFSRYKFVAKMLTGKRNVVEVGCGDAFGSRLVKQEVETLTVTDFDPLFIRDIEERASERWPMRSFVHDALSGPVAGGPYDGLYSLDVMEHLPQSQEDHYLENITASVTDDAAVIIGMPSLESQQYASPASQAGHINCKTGPDFRGTLSRHFRNVFLFSMNDEMVHTGYHKMAHYLLGVCTQPIRSR